MRSHRSSAGRDRSTTRGGSTDFPSGAFTPTMVPSSGPGFAAAGATATAGADGFLAGGAGGMETGKGREGDACAAGATTGGSVVESTGSCEQAEASADASAERRRIVLLVNYLSPSSHKLQEPR